MSDQDRTPRPGENARPRHADAAPQGDGPDPRRFFTDPPSGQPGNRHRRRRGPGDPTTTGSIPIVRVDKTLPDPTIEYRRPEASSPETGATPYFQVRYRDEPSTESMVQFTRPPDPAAQQPAPPRRAMPERVEPETVQQEAAAPAAVQADAVQTDADVDTPADHVAASATPPTFDVLESADDTGAAVAPEPSADDADTGEIPVVGGAMPPRKKRRWLMLIAALFLVAVLVVAGLGLKWLGVFESSTDFDSTTGSGAVLVEVPADAALRDVGQTLADAGVVGSKKAFVEAAESGGSVSAGFYSLPKGISARTAITMMGSDDHRVGYFIVPEGLQLDSRKSADGTTRPGIFDMVAKATAVKTDDGDYGVTADQLRHAAATASPAALGVPGWAQAKVKDLTGDHRRIEGLIASGAWEDIDPRLDATAILKTLITRSVERYTAWGLLSGNDTGRSPYETLTIASIVEGEAQKEDDFPKVARVIVNRLDDDRRLEMDSTANYTAEVSDIDLHGESYMADNEWNTYHHKGLPVTPIGAVGAKALGATESPTPGDWLYFVTVDSKGTTLFAKTFEQHKRNRQVACRNKFLTVGCE